LRILIWHSTAEPQKSAALRVLVTTSIVCVPLDKEPTQVRLFSPFSFGDAGILSKLLATWAPSTLRETSANVVDVEPGLNEFKTAVTCTTEVLLDTKVSDINTVPAGGLVMGPGPGTKAWFTVVCAPVDIGKPPIVEVGSRSTGVNPKIMSLIDCIMSFAQGGNALA